MTKGWICPRCGRAYAPWMTRCDECVPKTTSSSTNTPSPKEPTEQVWIRLSDQTTQEREP